MYLLSLEDFGFSRYFAQEELIQSFPITPLYAAPDLLKQNPYDERCDLWSIGSLNHLNFLMIKGVIAYEMVVGEPLFKVNSMQELRNAVENRQKVEFPVGTKVSAEYVAFVQQVKS